MIKTDDTRGAGEPVATPPQIRPSTTQYAPLLITFVLSDDGGVRRVRCHGCREILPPDHPTSEHIRGTVELDGRQIPIIDANIRVYAEQTPIAFCTCILIADRRWESKQLRGGVLVPHIEEVMQLAAGSFDSQGRAAASVNLRPVLESDEEESFTALLVESHRELGLLDSEWNAVPESLVLGDVC